MSITKIVDIESIRFGAPDLDTMRTFLTDFGLVDLGPQADGVLRMRASGAAPVVHETEQGEAGFRALTMRASSMADLEALAAHDGVSVEATNRPGGGQMVRLTDPDGFVVEVIAGGTLRTPDTAPKSAYKWNGERTCFCLGGHAPIMRPFDGRARGGAQSDTLALPGL